MHARLTAGAEGRADEIRGKLTSPAWTSAAGGIAVVAEAWPARGKVAKAHNQSFMVLAAAKQKERRDHCGAEALYWVE